MRKRYVQRLVSAVTLLATVVIAAACSTPAQPVPAEGPTSQTGGYVEDPLPTAAAMPDPEAAPTGAPGEHEDAIGVITALDAASITVDGILYGMSASTEVKGNLALGSRVKVEFITNADASRTALEIKTGEYFEDGY